MDLLLLAMERFVGRLAVDRHQDVLRDVLNLASMSIVILDAGPGVAVLELALLVITIVDEYGALVLDLFAGALRRLPLFGHLLDNLRVGG
eukprot:CAMPEP_0174896572 /NCGR_PEP_ID=MMETSP0167-20121228/10728_1 /TAXON_ID=38298 /ORGANISM="Rhodella maculata, Strain CCMP736" /LENGTH=89 /DNA_ID=CAMNT_0016136167 /DNA_START=315 /DNA_END=581 /DNA_ORIENTATION=-